MINTNINGMDRKAVAANNNINNYKFYVGGMADFADFAEAIDFIKNNNWAMCVRGYDSIRVGLNRNMDGEYTASMVALSKDCATAIIRKDIALGERMTQKKVERIAIEVLDLIAMVEKMNTEGSNNTLEETPMETATENSVENTDEMNKTLGSDETLDSEDESDAIAEQMSEVVAEYQIKVDEQMSVLYSIAESFDKIKYRIEYARAASVVRRIEKLSWDCLQDCGEISGCDMCPDDGYCPNIDALIKWADGVLIDDLEETLDYMAVYEDRVAPIATDMVELLDSEWGYDYVMAPMTEDEAIKWYSLNYEDIKAMADEQKIELYALAF